MSRRYHRDISVTAPRLPQYFLVRILGLTPQAMIGIGGRLAAPLLPHHRAYGSRTRRFGWSGPAGGVQTRQTERVLPLDNLVHHPLRRHWTFRQRSTMTASVPLPLSAHESHLLLAPQPFGPSPSPGTMPSADFCPAVRSPHGDLSRFRDTRQTSRGKLDSLPCTSAESTLRALTVDMDFVVDRPLVRRSRLLSGSCPSARTFAPRFLQTPPRDDALALRYPFTSTRLERGLSPPSCRACPAHDPSTRSLRSLAQDDS